MKQLFLFMCSAGSAGEYGNSAYDETVRVIRVGRVDPDVTTTELLGQMQKALRVSSLLADSIEAPRSPAAPAACRSQDSSVSEQPAECDAREPPLLPEASDGSGAASDRIESQPLDQANPSVEPGSASASPASGGESAASQLLQEPGGPPVLPDCIGADVCGESMPPIPSTEPETTRETGSGPGTCSGGVSVPRTGTDAMTSLLPVGGTSREELPAVAPRAEGGSDVIPFIEGPAVEVSVASEKGENEGQQGVVPGSKEDCQRVAGEMSAAIGSASRQGRQGGADWEDLLQKGSELAAGPATRAFLHVEDIVDRHPGRHLLVRFLTVVGVKCGWGVLSLVLLICIFCCDKHVGMLRPWMQSLILGMLKYLCVV